MEHETKTVLLERNVEIFGLFATFTLITNKSTQTSCPKSEEESRSASLDTLFLASQLPTFSAIRFWKELIYENS